VTRFEIWNEPNAELFWHPTHRAAERYAELYLAAHAAIRQAVPSARVVVGGLALGNHGVLDEHEFIETMVAHRPELLDAVDAIALHPYAPTADGVIAKIRELRWTVERLGLGDTPLEITGVGWTTTKTSEPQRAEALRQFAEQLPRSDCKIASLIAYTWLTKNRTLPTPSTGSASTTRTPPPNPPAAPTRQTDASSPKTQLQHCRTTRP